MSEGMPRHEEPSALLQRARALARKAPLAEVCQLLEFAAAGFQERALPLRAAEVLIEEARLVASSFEAPQLRRATDLLSRASTLVDAEDCPRLRASLEHARGYVLSRRGRVGQAVSALLRAVRGFRDLGDRGGEAQALDTLGALWDRRGDRERAVLVVAQALALKQLEGDRQGMAISLGTLGRIALRARHLEEAESFLRLDLDLADQLGDRRGEATVRTNLSECLLELSRTRDAEKEARRALELGRAMNDGVRSAFALIALAGAVSRAGRSSEALSATEKAEEQFRVAGMPAGRGYARLARARILAATGEPGLAARSAVGAARAARLGGVPEVEIEALLEAHRAFQSAGDKRRSRRFLQRAQERAMRHGLDALASRVLREQRAVVGAQADDRDVVELVLEAGAGPFEQAAGRRLSLRVEGFLGQGAFATVVKVRREEEDAVYALKRLHAGRERLRAMEDRLRREFTAVARVSHPRIVRPLAFGREEGRPCLLLECVESAGKHGSLDDLIQDLEVLPVIHALRIGADVAAGLQALHVEGVMHRDLKPANILLDRESRAVLTDFGLAYDIHETAYVPLQSFKGSLAFAAPELCVLGGDIPLPTPVTDLYSLGVVLFLALAGTWPLPLDEARESLVDLFKLKASEPKKRLADLRSEVPRELSDLVHSLLAVSPAARPQEAGDVARDLEAMREAF